MVQQQILQLLTKISLQLEGISNTQDSIQKEILLLSSELAEFQEFTLRKLNHYLAREKEVETNVLN